MTTPQTPIAYLFIVKKTTLSRVIRQEFVQFEESVTLEDDEELIERKPLVAENLPARIVNFEGRDLEQMELFANRYIAIKEGCFGVAPTFAIEYMDEHLDYFLKCNPEFVDVKKHNRLRESVTQQEDNRMNAQRYKKLIKYISEFIGFDQKDYSHLDISFLMKGSHEKSLNAWCDEHE